MQKGCACVCLRMCEFTRPQEPLNNCMTFSPTVLMSAPGGGVGVGGGGAGRKKYMTKRTVSCPLPCTACMCARARVLQDPLTPNVTPPKRIRPNRENEAETPPPFLLSLHHSPPSPSSHLSVSILFSAPLNYLCLTHSPWFAVLSVLLNKVAFNWLV